MKKTLIIMTLICSHAHLNAHRAQNMAKVTLKNTSSSQTLTIATHQGAISLPYGATKTLELQRGQSYDITVYDKKGAILGTTSEKFTPGTYEAKAEPDPESSDPNAVKITVIKPGLKPKYY